MKQVPRHSERAIPVVNYKQLLHKPVNNIRPAYKVNPDGTITFDRWEPYDNR